MGCPEKDVNIDGTSGNLQLFGKDMPNVKSTTHLGIQRAVSGPVTMEETVSNNIQKARKACYSLMSAGLHGHNGLDPATCIHLIKIYVLSVLTYGLEAIVPKTKHVDRLDFTAAGVVPCGGRKTSPRRSTIVQFIFYFGPLRSAIIF